MQHRLEACNFTKSKTRNQVIESYKSLVNFSYKAKKTAYSLSFTTKARKATKNTEKQQSTLVF